MHSRLWLTDKHTRIPILYYQVQHTNKTSSSPIYNSICIIIDVRTCLFTSQRENSNNNNKHHHHQFIWRMNKTNERVNQKLLCIYTNIKVVCLLSQHRYIFILCEFCFFSCCIVSVWLRLRVCLPTPYHTYTYT